MSSRNRITAGLAAVTVAFALGACDDNSPSSPSSPASVSSPTTVEPQFANNSRQEGLVNVSTGGIDVLNNVNLAVAANVVATVCDADVVLAILAEQVFADGSETLCEGTAEEVTITQATPGQNPGPAGGGNNSRQEGLINVSLGDVAILNDVNVAVAANVIATVCDVDIAAAVLAAQAIGDVSETACTSTAGPLELIQS
jgi:hypothetical protein